ncbi:MAG: ribonuclease III [Clostridium sp.]|nr:ribonuclease III [Clostridium sp.]MCM1208623.1 ribonuclease III [Ruminococcus sp.]
MNKEAYETIEAIVGYKFKDKNNLDIAFTHKSYANEIVCGKRQSYERFEFLGDAILEFVVSDYLFHEYQDKTEGELTKIRASLVCEFTLSRIARELKFGEYGLFSKGEKNTGGRDRDSILCDFFESVTGAIYIDGGLEEAKNFIYKFLLTDIESKKLFYDAKTTLQELSQKNNSTIEYVLLEESGPEHNKLFKMQLCIDGKPMAKGEGHSRKSAEQHAAYKALKQMLK